MRLCRFDDNRLGIVDGESLRDVTSALDVLPPVRYPLPKHDPLIAHLPHVLARSRSLAASTAPLPVAERVFLSPVASPGKLVAAPVNYHAHLDEVRADKAGLPPTVLAKSRQSSPPTNWNLLAGNSSDDCAVATTAGV